MKFPRRRQYLRGEVTHGEYYSAVAKTAGLDMAVGLVFKARTALALGDQALNSIPLPVWDALALAHARPIGSALHAHGDHATLAGSVCVLKQAACDAVARSCGPLDHGFAGTITEE